MIVRPTLADVLASAIPFALPLRRRFRGIDVREGVLLPGPSGWGEFAPFDDYSDQAAGRWLASALEAAYGSWPMARRIQIPVNAIIPELPASDAAQWARRAIEHDGCRTIKVKVGSPDLVDDEARVAAVREVMTEVLGAGVGAIRVDANGAWDVPAARLALHVLGSYGLEYVEQPCPTREQMAQVHRFTDVPLAADELVRGSLGPVDSLLEVADIAILKPAPLGGVEATLRQAERLDVPVVVSGSLDSSVGVATALAAAAALEDLPFACGLGTGALFAEDLVEPVLPRHGVVTVLRAEPDPEALAGAADRVGADRAAYWRQRLTDAWNVKG